MRTWSALATRLRPLIGEAGLCALYSRAVFVTRPAHACLGLGSAPRNVEALLGALRSELNAADTVAAGAACTALLATFTHLLASLIGTSLTHQLLNTALADGPEGTTP